MKSGWWIRRVASLVLLGIAFGCSGGDTTRPVAGTARVSLLTPNSDDGVVLLTLTGPSLANPQPASSTYRLYLRSVSSNELRVIVVGDLTAGAMLTLNVDDVSKLGTYGGTVVDAASRSDVERTSLAGYGVMFAVQQ